MNNESSHIPGTTAAITTTDYASSAKVIFFTLLIIYMISLNTQHMTDRMFWLDEVTAFRTAILPFFSIPLDAAVASKQMQPPIFYWIGHLAVQIGSDPFTLRAVSVAIYIVMIGFIIFFIHELQIATRVMLGFILIQLPFAEYATTEFRPYALAAFSILISSVFLYRIIQQPSNWSLATQYAFSALILQYSLTLNSFVFGIQMLFVSIFLIISFSKVGFSKCFKENKPLIIVTALLSIQYFIFLLWVAYNQPYYSTGLSSEYFKHITDNSKFLFNSITPDSWVKYIIFSLFVAGCIYGAIKESSVLFYLLILFVGQLYFSTYMTYSSISWFHQRYLVASYIAFSIICALGFDALVNHIGYRVSLILTFLILLLPLYSGIQNFVRSVNEPVYNPSTAIIEGLRCKKTKTIVLGEPAYITKVPWYAYRNDPDISVPFMEKNVGTLISHAAEKKNCFILQEFKNNTSYTGKSYKHLSTLPGYIKTHYATTPGLLVPNTAWLFSPVSNGNKTEPVTR